MKRTLLFLAGIVVLAGAAYFISDCQKESTPLAEQKIPGTHPAYFEQFRKIKQDVNGELPSDPWLSWMKSDKLMKKSVEFIETVKEVGPYDVGGRTRALIIDQDDPDRLYAGGVSGGLWISEDKGESWKQVNDLAPTLSITAIVQNPFDSDQLYYTVGEPTGNSAGIQTTGFFRSNDQGENFEYIQPKGGQAFSSVWDIDHSYTDTNTMYVGTHAQGVSISVDGGDSFYRLGTTAGKIHDIDAFPDSTVWFTRERVGIYIYDERTEKITRLTGGLPTSGFTRVLVERSKKYPDVAYAAFALTTSAMHSVYKTSDGGNTWTKLTNPPNYYNFEWYCLTLGVHPEDTNFVVLAGQHPAYSLDGGKAWKGLNRSHADYHINAFWDNSDEYLIGNDGGVHLYNKNNSDKTSLSLNNGYYVTQFYAGDVGPEDDDLIIGGTQDNGTWQTRRDDEMFEKVYGGDGAYCQISPTDKTVYFSTQNGYIRRTDTAFNGSTNINFRNQTSTSDFWFINPFELNPVDGDQIYFPTERHLFLSLDRGNSWTSITDRTPSFAYCVGITRESDPTVYLGGSTGLLRRIENATQAAPGEEYDMRPFMPNELRSGFIGNVEVDPTDETILYLAVNNYGTNDKVWKVEKADQDTPVFTSISGNLPTNLPVNWLEVNNQNTDEIVAATDFGLYATEDGGINWVKIEGVPNVQIPMIKLKESSGKLYVFTHGRGVWMVQLHRLISVEEVEEESNSISIYPNPTQDFVRFTAGKNARVSVYNLSGKRVEAMVQANEVDVRNLAVGTYFLRVEENGKIYQERFVKY